MSEASKLAEDLNNKLDSLHDSVVSDNPFSWSDSEEDREKRQHTFREISEKLSGFKYVSKAGAVLKIVLLGTVLPLGVLGLLYYLDFPADENARLFTWGGLALTALVSVIVAVIVGSIPSLDDEISLAAYTVPRGWSFSQKKSGKVWDEYQERFSYFDRGDENQYIGTRIWGHTDKERKLPFQMFHFHYDDVEYVQVPTYDSKGNFTGFRTEKRVHPHNRYGIFLTVPESKTRFRITEIGGDAGLDSSMKLEYADLNKAVDIYYKAEEELQVKQFLSPVVQEALMNLSNDFPDMLLDFYPGMALLATSHDLFGNFYEVSLDENAPKFLEAVKPVGERIDSAINSIREKMDR